MKSFILIVLFFTQILIAQPLKVGMELSYPPFETINTEGAPTGISVEIAKALGEYLDRPVEIVNIPFIGLIPALKTHKIDLILSSMTSTEQRKESIAFSEPYLTTGLCLLISNKSSLETIAQADHRRRRIVVKSGTSGEVYAKNHLHKATVIVLDKESACVLEVVQGKADAFIYDQFSIFTNWQKNLSTTRADLNPFQIEHWAVGLRKEDTKLLARVNQFIQHFRETGGFEKLGEKYLPLQKKAFKEMGISFVF